MGNMGTSGRPIPKPDCRVKNKTLGFAGPGNVKKPDERRKSIQAQNRNQFRTKLARGADRALGTTGKQTHTCREKPRAPLTQPQALLGPAP